jgi:hypothetical protein
MKFPKKTTYCLLLFLVLVNIMMRFPRTPHAIGVDSFVVKGLADSIAIDGFAIWMLHPLSYLGLFPLSYPSGGIYFVATYEVLTGDLGETSLLVISMLLGVLGVPIAFMMAREFKDDDAFALVVAFIFSLSPKFINTTMWESPTRSAFMTFAPLFLWALLRAHKSPDRKNVALVILILFFVATFHRLAVLMIVVIVGYIITYMFIILIRLFKIKLPGLLLRERYKRRIRPLAIAGFLGMSFAILLASGVLENYTYGRLLIGDDVATETLNLGISLTRSVGLLLPLFIVGIIAIGYQRNKTIAQPLFLFVIIGLIPTLVLRVYTGFYVLSFMSIFIGAGVVAILRLPKKRRFLSVVMVSALFAGSVAFANYMQDYEIKGGDYMSEHTYTTGLYARYMTEGTIVSNDGLIGSRISTITHRPYLPVGGATTVHYGPEQLSFRFVDPSDVQVVQVPLTELTVESDSPFAVTGTPKAVEHWAQIMDNSLESDTAQSRLEEYGVRIAVEDKHFYGAYRAYGNIYYGAPFPNSVHWQRYKIYEESYCILWMVK